MINIGGGGGGLGFLGLFADNPDLLKGVQSRKQAEEDRELEAARKRLREAERLRQGRRASILTSPRGVTEPLGTANRPRASSLLGSG